MIQSQRKVVSGLTSDADVVRSLQKMPDSFWVWTHFLQILEPSKELAVPLIELGLQHPPTRKLGMDMLRERGLHHDYVAALLQDGYYLEALRYARKYRVRTPVPSALIFSFVPLCSVPSVKRFLYPSNH